MKQTEIKEELREIETILSVRLSAIHDEIERLKPHDKPKPDIEFERITSEAAKKPLFREDLRAAQPTTKKAFFAALAYLVALDSENLEDKLYYLCRLAQGCEYQASAEELCQLGLDYAPQDMSSLGQYIGGLKDLFMVEALVLANIAGGASRGVFGVLATLADSLDIKDYEMRTLGQAAQVALRSCYISATIEQDNFWAVLANCNVGDTVTFGKYPQRVNGEAGPIEWQVLRRDDDGLLVISKYALDCKPYNVSNSAITWSECTLRKWLNSEFISRAFDETERQHIREVHLNNSNSKFNSSVSGGYDTTDKIFLLSHEEAEQLFANNYCRKCQVTAYAKKKDAWTGDNGMCAWWLRSPGRASDKAALVHNVGGINCDGVGNDNITVRPVFKIAI